MEGYGLLHLFKELLILGMILYMYIQDGDSTSKKSIKVSESLQLEAIFTTYLSIETIC